MKMNNIAVDGGFMDDDDMEDLLAIELALQNPRKGTSANQLLEALGAQARERDARNFPTISHPLSGALCFCLAHCSGAHCRCWCHAGESP